jgi:hypothetical protein
MADETPNLVHEVRLITPDEAKHLLIRVRNDAPIDKRQVSTYARDMAAGLWKLNGDPIILDQEGEVMSGRLRLHAAIEAAAAFPTLIVRNVDSTHFDTIDALRRRTVSDIMSIRKEKNGRALAAALAVLWRFSNDDYPTLSKKTSPQALIVILEQNPDIRFSAVAAKPASPRVAHGLGTALHFMFSRVDAAKADEFFKELGSDGEGSTPANQSLLRQLDESIREGGRRSQTQVAGILIRSWEAFRSGRALTLVRYSPLHDVFPKITGLGPKVRFDGVKQSVQESSRSPGPISSELRPLKVHVEMITPGRAREILERNDRNRAIAAAVVEKYKRDMLSGAWALNGQTIKIGETGQLLDGQHRCAAAVQANVSFPAIVVEGLDDDVFDTFDLGTRRSISLLLRDRKETNTANLAAALRNVWLLENELITLRNVAPTVSELLDTLEKNPDIRESIKMINKVRDVTSSLALALHLFFHRIDATKADNFMERLGDGVMLDATSPILKLREILLADKANQKRRLSETEKAAMMIKAWNFYVRDLPVRNLKWQNSGDRREPFPKILGLEGLAT